MEGSGGEGLSELASVQREMRNGWEVATSSSASVGRKRVWCSGVCLVRSNRTMVLASVGVSGSYSAHRVGRMVAPRGMRSSVTG